MAGTPFLWHTHLANPASEADVSESAQEQAKALSFLACLTSQWSVQGAAHLILLARRLAGAAEECRHVGMGGEPSLRPVAGACQKCPESTGSLSPRSG